MKNWITGIAASVLALGLAACNAPAEPKKDPETGKPEQVEKKSAMTAQQVYKKSMEVSAEQKSMHAKMDIEQSIEMPSEELDMNSKIKMDMDMVIDPMEMYQKMTWTWVNKVRWISKCTWRRPDFSCMIPIQASG